MMAIRGARMAPFYGIRWGKVVLASLTLPLLIALVGLKGAIRSTSSIRPGGPHTLVFLHIRGNDGNGAHVVKKWALRWHRPIDTIRTESEL
jgi:hypothetical protein